MTILTDWARFQETKQLALNLGWNENFLEEILEKRHGYQEITTYASRKMGASQRQIRAIQSYILAIGMLRQIEDKTLKQYTWGDRLIAPPFKIAILYQHTLGKFSETMRYGKLLEAAAQHLIGDLGFSLSDIQDCIDAIPDSTSPEIEDSICLLRDKIDQLLSERID